MIQCASVSSGISDASRMSAAPPAPEAMIVRSLTKRFGALTAVDDVSLTVRSGETVALWGPNGAGKTTILRCVLGLMPFEGMIAVLGRDVRREGKAARRLLGYVPQELGLYRDQTVLESVSFYARLRRVPVPQGRALLETWGLSGAAEQPVRTLSGGMKQKLALVIALLGDPPVMLLDEPTSHLDARARREFSELLLRLKDARKTLLFCSHRMSEVTKLADRVVILEQGRANMVDTPDRVQEHLPDLAALVLTIPRAQQAEAVALLQRHDFSVSCNGTQVWVEVRAARKVEPLRLLHEARIPVADFDVEAAQSNLGASKP